MTVESYRVRLALFEGPLDLLLHLCRRQEVDIRDIPVASITEQYLEYLDLMKSLDLEVAGSYLAMAATLCHIKSVMLIPRETASEEGEDGPDPRAELVRQLLEYQRYRDAAEQLVDATVLDRDAFEPTIQPEVDDDGERPIEGSLFLMLDALRELLAQRRLGDGEHRVEVTRFTVADQMRAVVERMRTRPRLAFDELFGPDANREEILVTFLALLEMVRLRFVTLVQAGHLESIELKLEYQGTVEDLPVPGEEESP